MNCSDSSVVGEEKQNSSQEEVKKISDALEWCLDRSGCEDLDNNDLESLSRSSVSSGASHCSCDTSAADNHFNSCHDNNASVELMDGFDNDFSDDSDLSADELDWRDFDDAGPVNIIRLSASSQSSHEFDGMSDGLELMDALSDFSDEETRQVTIAIDIDSSSQDDMSELSEGRMAEENREDDEDSDYEVYAEEDQEEEEDDDDVDVNFDEGGFTDDLLATSDDSDCDLVDDSSRWSSQSDGSFHGGSPDRGPEPESPRSDIPPPAGPPQPRNVQLQPTRNPTPPSSQPNSVVAPPASAQNSLPSAPAQNSLPSASAQNSLPSAPAQNSLPPAPAQDSPPPADGPSKNGPEEPSTSTLPAEGGDSEDRICCICLDNMSDHIVVPCGHMCLCQDCKELLVTDVNHRKKRKCPMCKTPFSIIIKVFK